MTLSPSLIAAVAAGGALGATARYLTGYYAVKWFGPAFPWGTFSVNVLGSFLMGVVVHYVAVKGGISKEVTTFVTVGILGGFTTFSTFSMDAASMIERGQLSFAAVYILGSVGVGLAALFAGLAASRWAFT